jgi:hypothetical protein
VFGASLDPAQTSGPEENVSRAVEKPSLSDIVAAVIEASSSSGPNKYFRPPPEARFMTNRNIYTRKEGPMASVAAYEQPIRPSDIQLDSTRCYSNFDPPIKFVSTHIFNFYFVQLTGHSVILSNSCTMSIQQS